MKIPVIPHWPLIGNAWAISQDILGFQQRNFRRYGNTFMFYLPFGQRVVLTCDKDVFKHILQQQHKNYRKDYDSNKLKLALGNGLLTNEGESWFRQRRLAQPAFYKKRLEGFFDTMNQLTLAHLQELSADSEATVQIDREMMQLTSKIVIETLLGKDIGDEMSQLQQHITFIQEHLVNLIRRPFYRFSSKWNGKEQQFQQTMRDFDAILYAIIRQRKAAAPQNDLLSMLMDARDADTGEGMSDRQLRDELLTIYVAGHETSGYALSWAIYNLYTHPASYQKAVAEVRAVMPDGQLTVENYKSLVYLKQVIDETLRLYPTAYLLSRESKAAETACGLEIPEKTLFLLSTYFLHRHPDYWQEPDAFIPERFDGNTNVLFNSEAYYPFGGGPRMCIGFHFATMEITIVLAQLLYHFDISLTANGKPVVAEPLITLKPKDGIHVRLTKKLT